MATNFILAMVDCKYMLLTMPNEAEIHQAFSSTARMILICYQCMRCFKTQHVYKRYYLRTNTSINWPFVIYLHYDRLMTIFMLFLICVLNVFQHFLYNTVVFQGSHFDNKSIYWFQLILFKLRQKASRAIRATDKMPYNFLYDSLCSGPKSC